MHAHDILGGVAIAPAQRGDDLLVFLQRLLSEVDVTTAGEFYDVPEATTIMPRSYKERRIPIWLGSTSRDSIRWAASQGCNVVTTSLREPIELLRKQAQWFHEAAEELPADVERPKVDVLTQVSAATKALEAVALSLLEDHLRHCVHEAIAGTPDTHCDACFSGNYPLENTGETQSKDAFELPLARA